MEPISDPLPESEKSVVAQNRPLDFPDEILITVFRHALPPSWVMDWADTSVAPFPPIWSADLRTKLAIIGVSKTWHRIGLEFLYESVVLRRIGQMPAFVRALEGREDVGGLVRHLQISYFLPRGYYGLHDSQTRIIMALCSNISHFAFTPRTLLCTLPSVGSTITSLEYGPSLEYSDILPSLVQLCPTLRSLSLTLPEKYSPEHPTLTFPNLENVRLELASDSTIPGSRWVIPGLRRAVLRDRFRLAFPSYRSRQLQVQTFLDAYGRTIKTLVVLFLKLGDLQLLLDRCPVLEHISASASFCLWPLHPPTLRSIDILCYPIDAGVIGQSEWKFPALRVCRYMDGGLEHFRDISPTIPTGDEVGSDELTVVTDDSLPHLPQSSWLAVMLSEVGAADDSSDDDPDYVFNSDDDDGGSMDDSDSDSDSDAHTVSEGWVDEFRMPEDCEIDSDEALAIFRSTLR
ncbi:hypothetical protein B0H17DRAFT_1080465 [Mycena rosella]|uniref:Uncharacterized protein n=1 Tax=Mycena rosella TaxID=1033263 RepID=A0AAD7D2W6_MYCRO|nr:hypothetical protein B0H17DRAFT_1080465 [Mycena rosella]